MKDCPGVLACLTTALLAIGAAPLPAAEAACRPVRTLTLQLRLAGDAPRPARLRGTGTDLVLEDVRDGAVLWSAGSGSGTTQRVPGMTAPFGESFAALDLDGDGLHDRLYAADQAGRLWRFTLRPGAQPDALASGGIWADLGESGGGRGFIAPPDITQLQPPGLEPWLNIALGSASTGVVPVANRFYLLRDSLQPDLPARPIDESLLLPLSFAADTPAVALQPFPQVQGYYLPLGLSQVFAPALTLSGRVHFTVVETSRPLLVECPPDTLPVPPVPLSLSILRAEDGRPAGTPGLTAHESVRRSLSHALPADTGPTLEPATTSGTPGGTDRLECRVGDEPVPGCELDVSPRRAGWRREDVD